MKACCQLGLAASCARCNAPICMECGEPLAITPESTKTIGGRWCASNHRCRREQQIEQGELTIIGRTDAEILSLARMIGDHWRTQEGVNGALLDQLAQLAVPADCTCAAIAVACNAALTWLEITGNHHMNCPCWHQKVAPAALLEDAAEHESAWKPGDLVTFEGRPYVVCGWLTHLAGNLIRKHNHRVIIVRENSYPADVRYVPSGAITKAG